VQPITILGLALFFVVLYFRMRAARGQAPSSTKQRFKTGHVLLGVLLAWLIINFNLRHLDSAISGEPAPPSTWERVVRTVADWI
jgi:hypothetical protein